MIGEDPLMNSKNALHITFSPSYSALAGMVNIALPLWKSSSSTFRNIARLDPLTLQLMTASVDSWLHLKTAFREEPTGNDTFEGVTKKSNHNKIPARKLPHVTE